jgi:transposase
MSHEGSILWLIGNQTRTLRLRRGDRKVLESWARSRTLPPRQVDRAKILLGASKGESSRGLAQTVGVARDTARLWIRRYEAEGLGAVERDRPRRGRPRKLTPELERDIVEKTVNEGPPPGEGTHWTSRLLGRVMGITHMDVWRTWRKYGLKPHQIRRFKLSRDPRLVEKLHDVVGVYMNPPDNAVVFSFDEKSQIQALDRTQPGLPLKRGRAGTMTHDYKAARDHHSFRRARGGHRRGDPRVHAPPSASGVPEVRETDREERGGRARHPCRPRRLRDPQARESAPLA